MTQRCSLSGSNRPYPNYEFGAFARLLKEHSLFGNSKWECRESNPNTGLIGSTWAYKTHDAPYITLPRNRYQSMVSYSPSSCQAVLERLSTASGVSHGLGFERPLLFFTAVVLPVGKFHWGVSTCVYIEYHTSQILSRDLLNFLTHFLPANFFKFFCNWFGNFNLRK